MEQRRPSGPNPSLDPVIKAVYILYKCEDAFLPAKISSLVGESPPSYGSNRLINPEMYQRNNKKIVFRSGSPSKPESVFDELETFCATMQAGYPVKFYAKIDLDEVPSFKLMLIRFKQTWNPAVDRQISKVVQLFMMAVAEILKTQDPLNTSFHLLYLAYFIDLLLTMQPTESEQRELLMQRSNTVNKSLTLNMKIQEMPKFLALADVYGTTINYIDQRVIALKGECRPLDIRTELEQKKSYRRYKQTDFEPDRMMDYLEWMKGRDEFFQLATSQYERAYPYPTGAAVRGRPRPVSPDSPYTCLDRVLDVFLTSGRDLPNILIDILCDCTLVWQLDGYEVFNSVLKAYVRAYSATGKLELLESARNAAKKLLKFTRLPYKIEIWPIPIKSQLTQIMTKINGPLMNSICVDLIPDFFNPQTLSQIILQLTSIKFNSFAGVDIELKQKLEKAVVEFVDARNTKRTRQLPKTNISLTDLLNMLETAIQDLLYLNSQLLSDFETRHSTEWNFVQILRYKTTKSVLRDTCNIIKYLSQPPVPDQSGKYIRRFNNPEFTVDSPVYNSILEDILSIKSLSQFPNDEFSKIVEQRFFYDYYSRNVERCAQLESYALNAIKNDQFVHVEGQGYSKSVVDLIALFEKYLNDIKALNWHNDFQRARLYTTVYETIADILNFYSETLTTQIVEALNSSTGSDQLIDEKSAIKINDLYTMISKLDTVFKDEVIDALSKIIDSHTQGNNDAMVVMKGKKLISIKILRAENIEDPSTGKPLNAFVAMTGCINDKTRTIHQDAYPEWSEEFEAVIDNSRPHEIDMRIFDEIKKDQSKFIESFEYSLRFDPTKDGVPQSIVLAKNYANIHFTYTYETVKNDPVFYNGRIRTTLQRSTQRIMKLLVSKYIKLVSNAFTRESLDSMFVELEQFYKIGDFFSEDNDPSQITDSIIVDVEETLMSTVLIVSQDLVSKAVDELILNTWEVTLTHATNLILLPLAAIKSSKMLKQLASLQQDRNLLNRLSVSVKQLNLRSDSGPLKLEEIERVISWVYKLFITMRTNLADDMHDDMVTPLLEQLLDVRALYRLSFQELQIQYKNALKACQVILNSKIESFAAASPTTTYSNGGLRRKVSVMRQGSTTNRKVETNEEHKEQAENRCFSGRELILRVALTKEGPKAIEFVTSRVDEFTRFTKEVDAKVAAQKLIKQRNGSNGSARSSNRLNTLAE
ncbi:hypothetical protein CANARDRAFT_23282 [[Candida] arabinofermentans NRRL YB-2248]|uniref:C2 domain-containing protein n=1 Tax=[Candida] arabinofermentans NRRL YB-2248 TaxID=983967 RepID=A0A1E4T0E7_9ASCO|nr:hypothetical protein CANARDRAFT_23282 [[Candida] arabinofermentans NRRL YB-2248]